MFNKGRYLIVALLLAVTCLAWLPFAQTAHAQAAATQQTSSAAHPSSLAVSSASVTFHFQNNKSTLCLGIAQGQLIPIAIQWNCVNHPDQIWQTGAPNPNGDLSQQLRNNSGQCLGVQGGGTAAGTALVGWTCNGHSDQYWKPLNPYANITPWVNDQSGDIIGIEGGLTTPGAVAVLWPFVNNHPDQWWKYCYSLPC